MKLKLFIAKIWDYISSIWKKVSNEIKDFTTVAVNVVEAIKLINNSFAGDVLESILSSVIPGTADDVFIKLVRDKLRVALPKIIIELNIINSISGTQDVNEQLKAILSAINLSSDNVKSVYYHSICVLILEALSDGKLTFSESIQISEYYYTNIYKV